MQLQAAVGNRATARMLARATKGPSTASVLGWQKHLNTWWALPEELKVDGIDGPKTRTAIQLWQWHNGQPITGNPESAIALTTQGGGV